MDYISRYGFEFNPYTKSQKSFLIETSQYREVISRQFETGPDLSIRLRTRLYTSLFQLLQ